MRAGSSENYVKEVFRPSTTLALLEQEALVIYGTTSPLYLTLSFSFSTRIAAALSSLATTSTAYFSYVPSTLHGWWS